MKIYAKFLKSALAALAVCGAQLASASPLLLTLDNSKGTVIDSFKINSTAGQVDGAGSDYVLFTTTNDLDGYNGVFFGDANSGGWFGIGDIGAGNIVSQSISDYFASALYSGSGLVPNIAAGSSYVAENGDVLHVAKVPEPGTLMLVGISLLALIGLRRRRS